MSVVRVDPVEIVAGDGAVLRGQLWPGSESWVVLLHDAGGGNDLDCWSTLAPLLAARGWTVLAVDLRGHGGSDGKWDERWAIDDEETIVAFARSHGAAFVVIAGAGASATVALCGASRTHPDALILLSPSLAPDQSLRELRGAGEAKLLVVGGGDEAMRQVGQRLGAAAVGWVLLVTLPVFAQGTDLLEGATAGHLKEQIVGFLAEQRFLAGRDPRGRAARDEESAVRRDANA